MPIRRRVYQIVPHLTDVRNAARHRTNNPPSRLKDRMTMCIHGCQDNRVYLRGRDFAKIFGNTHADMPSKTKPFIVKIVNGKKNIHRLYTCSDVCSNTRDFVGLTYNSLLHLVADRTEFESLDNLSLSEGNYLVYAWTTMSIVAKSSWVIGLLGLVVGVLSLIY